MVFLLIHPNILIFFNFWAGSFRFLIEYKMLIEWIYFDPGDNKTQRKSLKRFKLYRFTVCISEICTKYTILFYFLHLQNRFSASK